MLNDWTNYGPGQGGGDIKKQYGKRSHLKIDVTRIIEDEENMKQNTDSEKSTGNQSSIYSAHAPSSNRARTTPRLTVRNPNIISEKAVEDVASRKTMEDIASKETTEDIAPKNKMEDLASRKTKFSVRDTSCPSKNFRVRRNGKEIVEIDSPAADTAAMKNGFSIPIAGRLTRSISCRTVPSNLNNLKKAVEKGNREDIVYVLQQINNFLSSSGWFEFSFHLPNSHDSARAWLETAGFQETQVGKFIFLDHQHVIKELHKLLSERLTQMPGGDFIASRGRSTSLVDVSHQQPSALLPPSNFPHGLEISIPSSFAPIEPSLPNGPTPRSHRANHVRQSSNAQSMSALIDPQNGLNLSNRFPRRDDGSFDRSESPFSTEPDTPKSIGQKSSPYSYSGPSTASTANTFNNLYSHRQSSPLEFSFINQFSQSNLDNSLPIFRQNSHGSVSTSTQSDDNSLTEKFRSITTADPNQLGDSQGTDYDYLPPSAQDSYLPIEQTYRICDDSLKFPGPGHDSDLYESDTSTVKDFSFISESGDVFNCDPQPFLEPVVSHLQTSFKKTNSFADCPVPFEVELKDPMSEYGQDLNDLDSYPWGIPPRNTGHHYSIPLVAGRSDDISDILGDGPAISPQLAARGLYDDDRSSYGICNNDEVKFVSKSERESKECLRTGQAVNNNRKTRARRSISDSAVRSSVNSVPESLPAGIHPGSVTPGPVSLSQNAADNLDPLRATYYQTPQAIRSKFESSQPASPKEIEFLLKQLEMHSGQEDLQLEGVRCEFFDIPLIPPIGGPFGVVSRPSGVTFENGTSHEPLHCLFDLKDADNARKLSLSSGGKSLVHSASSPSLSEMYYDCHNSHPESSLGTLHRSGSNAAIDDALSCVRSLNLKRCKSLPTGLTDNSCDNSLVMEQTFHMDTSSIHSNSHTFLGTEAGFYSCEEEAAGPDDAGSRKDKKKRMSILKYGRMSVKRMNGRGVHLPSNGFSPSAMSKVRWQRRRRLQAGNVSRDDVTPYAISRLDHDSSLDHSHQNHSRLVNLNISTDAHSVIEDVSKCADDSHMQLPHSELNEHSFMGTVIGGVYQHCFDELCPVVAPPSSSESRAVGLHFTVTKSIILHIFVPKKNKIDNVEFTVEWKCIRASPTGFLLTEKSHMRDHRLAVYYYIHKHPYDWSAETDERRANGFEICMESRPFHIPNMEDIHEPFSSEQEEDDGYGMHMELESPMETKVDTCAEWYNSSIMRMVLEYLVGARITTTAIAPPAVKGPPAKSDSRKVSRRQNGATQDSSHAIGASEGQDSSFFSQCESYYLVCKAWALSIHMLSAQRLSNIVDSPSSRYNYEKWSKFVSSHVCGDFLGDGACKNVYAVSTAESRVVAVSVMDVNKLVDEGMDCPIRQELEISMLCSSLVTLNICPNLVRIYSMFQSEYPAPELLWSSGNVLGSSGSGAMASAKSVALPTKAMMSRSKGSYQFCCMEFCSGGDIEGLIRKEKRLEVSVVRSFLFQMCFALYTCREKLSLRHFDIKLLNFLATRGSSVLPSASQGNRNSSADAAALTDLQVGFGKHVYSLPVRANENSIVKLADFGTSIIGEMCLGDNINKMQFTTLENTPPEFLLLGSSARQCFSSDTFPLGLCFIHLLTGYQPYEELMKNVHCPAYLASKLAVLWHTEDVASPYLVMREVIVSILPPDASGSAQVTVDSGSVLFDTLYRYMVLVGHSFGEGTSSKRSSSPLAVSACSAYSSSAVWTAVVEALGLALDDDAMDIIVSDKRSVKTAPKFSEDEIRSLRNMESKKRSCLKQYKSDLGKWSIRLGKDKKMINLRSRLDELGSGAAPLLESMLHFDPSKRCTMYDALNSSVFHVLRSDLARPFKCSSSGYVGSTSAASYMHYYHPGDGTDGCPDSLPIL